MALQNHFIVRPRSFKDGSMLATSYKISLNSVPYVVNNTLLMPPSDDISSNISGMSDIIIWVQMNLKGY